MIVPGPGMILMELLVRSACLPVVTAMLPAAPKALLVSSPVIIGEIFVNATMFPMIALMAKLVACQCRPDRGERKQDCN